MTRTDVPWGFPTKGVAQRALDEQDFEQAVIAYRFWYPTVAMEALLQGTRMAGGERREELLILCAGPLHEVFTASSDTPYASAALDLRGGPIVVELPPGPFVGLVSDHHQRWIMDLGLPGPDRGQGGKHVILPPDFRGAPPPDHHVGRSATRQALVAIRALPTEGSLDKALEALRAIRLYAWSPEGSAQPARCWNSSDQELRAAPLAWEERLDYWTKLHEVLEAEPWCSEFFPMYGLLGALGIRRGRPFAPDARMKMILERAALAGREQMLVAAFASTREDRTVWRDRRWEWAALVGDHEGFERAAHVDLEARDRWFIQAVLASPAMFARAPGAGSLYWLGLRDKSGAYLDGARTYRLVVPLPVPESLLWSVTVYDASTRSQIRTDQGRATIRSSVELAQDQGRSGNKTALYFGPKEPPDNEARWIKTSPGRGWFAYFRIHGPTRSAFDGTWRPGDFELIA